MTDRPSFETKLTKAFAAYADRAPTDVDAFAVVAAASGGLAARRWSWSSQSRRWSVPNLLGLLLLALAAGTLFVGRSPSITPPVLGHLAFTRVADVYITAPDGDAPNRILRGDPDCRTNGDCWYSVGWSASGEFLAATDAQRVVIVRPDGREVRRFEGGARADSYGVHAGTGVVRCDGRVATSRCMGGPGRSGRRHHQRGV